MKPVKNWRAVLRRAWSVRLMLVAAVLTGLEAILPMLSTGSNPIGFAALNFLVVCGALIARFFAQPSLKQGQDDESKADK